MYLQVILKNGGDRLTDAIKIINVKNIQAHKKGKKINVALQKQLHSYHLQWYSFLSKKGEK